MFQIEFPMSLMLLYAIQMEEMEKEIEFLNMDAKEV